MEGRQSEDSSNSQILLILISTALLLSFFLFITANVMQPAGTITHQKLPFELNLSPRKLHLKENDEKIRDRVSKRKLIGSTAPTCTFNECRGCKHRCQAEQIPVDANDPVNSAYRYKCICHR